jgi:hypothetical protein
MAKMADVPFYASSARPVLNASFAPMEIWECHHHNIPDHMSYATRGASAILSACIAVERRIVLSERRCVAQVLTERRQYMHAEQYTRGQLVQYMLWCPNEWTRLIYHD